MADGLLRLVERHLPDSGRSSSTELSTPATIASIHGHHAGAIYGLPVTPERYRLAHGATTPVENLLITGADVCSPGIEGALMGPRTHWRPAWDPSAFHCLVATARRSTAVVDGRDRHQGTGTSRRNTDPGGGVMSCTATVVAGTRDPPQRHPPHTHRRRRSPHTLGRLRDSVGQRPPRPRRVRGARAPDVRRPDPCRARRRRRGPPPPPIDASPPPRNPHPGDGDRLHRGRHPHHLGRTGWGHPWPVYPIASGVAALITLVAIRRGVTTDHRHEHRSPGRRTAHRRHGGGRTGSNRIA